jgi:transposase
MEPRAERASVQFKQRAVIEFLAAEGVSPVEIHQRMQVVYGDNCVDVSTVRCWAYRSKDGEPGKYDLCDKQRTGRPVTATDEFHKEQVDEMIKENRRIT